jgi:hypothetical protein
MRIGLLTNLEGQRAWHRWLAADLARSGHDLIILRPASDAMLCCPSSLQIALWLDPIFFKLKGERAFDLLAAEAIPERAAGSAADGEILDVLIDASSGAALNLQARRIIRLLFNNEPTELAAVNAVLDPWPVVLTIDDGTGAGCEKALPGIEQRDCLSGALDNLFSGVVELLAERIKFDADQIENSSRKHVAFVKAHGPKLGTLAGARYIANVAAKKIAMYLDRHARAKQSWAIATRNCAGSGLARSPWPSEATYDVVADDGHRFFADPFLFDCGGRTHLFAEEFPLATGRGIISVAEIDARGIVGAFHPVLERNYHLSYPFVFSHGGEIWMVPEACESGAVELYRAVEYPNRWAFDRTLLDDVPGCDPTIIPFGGMYFMLLTTTRWRGSTWDKQRIFMAASPLGPWKEQDGGLVRMDCTNARPAGAAIVSGGRVLRPAQNCSNFYGGSMTLLEVRRLSASRCHEVPLATIKAVKPSGVLGTHTYSKSRSIEAVDVWGEVSNARRVKLECAPITGVQATTDITGMVDQPATGG